MEHSVPTGWAESAMSPTPFPRAPDNLQRSLNGFFTTLEKAQNGHMMLRLLYRRRKGCTGTAQFQSMRLQACHRPPMQRMLSSAPSREFAEPKGDKAAVPCGSCNLMVETGHNSQGQQNVPLYTKPLSIWKTEKNKIKLKLSLFSKKCHDANDKLFLSAH